ncbi:MAG: tRNA guanosine(34) transglycosylase Tgt [Flavobacteriales bacterium]|nr:tRNA guanosine(34) transglycosylase Tgt [Flavobacteriales bacterium]|tara:strand:- start:1413 stop:2543 length:1131 start_codon:yes stop_codon:yes gene_type:complete
MKFKILAKDSKSKARTGKIELERGIINTPIFMPVGTLGTVRGVHQSEIINDIKAEIILGNTYHLYLRPTLDVIQEAGGIHNFINYHQPILTDSGGYQVYSLSDNRKIKEEGVKFQSHIDGSTHFFTPENVMDIQRTIGADIIMAFDECTPYPCEYNYVKKSMELTHRWLKRCKIRFEETKHKYDYKQTLLPIVQGGTYKDLRKISAQEIVSHDFPANAIGGLSVGEPHDEMYEMTDIVTDILPVEKPRYLMGVGTPTNLLENISLGIDMFDCVMPTRNARNGLLYTMEGTINIKNKKWEKDFSPIDLDGTSKVDMEYSKAYLRHLMMSNEILGKQIASRHNLAFYVNLMKMSREKIKNGTFDDWKNKLTKTLDKRL